MANCVDVVDPPTELHAPISEARRTKAEAKLNLKELKAEVLADIGCSA